MLIINTPNYCSPEITYTLEVVFGQFLGLKYITKPSSANDSFSIQITDSTKKLQFPNIFFKKAEKDWLKTNTLPSHKLNLFEIENSVFENIEHLRHTRILYGGGKIKNRKDGGLDIPIDIIGAIFFMLSRYEEAVKLDSDNHDRFPFCSSFLSQNKLINHPLVDEYIEILWHAISYLWPQINRKKQKFSIKVSCDVDVPYSPHIKSISKTLRTMFGDVIKRRSPILAIKTGLNTIFSFFGNYIFEPNHTFDWIMDENEKSGNIVTFYFIAENSIDGMNGQYKIGEKRIRKLLRHIHARGHKIGLHGGYETFKNGDQYKKELKSLTQVLNEEHIQQEKIGNRQHYLRWDTNTTPLILDEAGVSYDTTLSFAEHAGFRCGTCHEYPMYDLRNRKKLNVKQQPLIVMEGSVISQSYMGLGETNNALNYMTKLKNICKNYNGTFSLLWHNDALLSIPAKKIYKELIK